MAFHAPDREFRAVSRGVVLPAWLQKLAHPYSRRTGSRSERTARGDDYGVRDRRSQGVDQLLFGCDVSGLGGELVERRSEVVKHIGSDVL